MASMIVKQLQVAYQAYNQGRLLEAEEACQKILKKTPKNADALHIVGLINLQRGNTAIATNMLAKAFALDKNNQGLRNNYVHAMYMHANTLAMSQGRYTEALPFYDLVIKFQPQFADAINNRGMALLELHEFAEAEKNFSRLLDFAPDYPFAAGWLMHAKLYSCSWNNYQALATRLEEELLAGKPADTPLSTLCYLNNAVAQLASAKAFCASQLAGVVQGKIENSNKANGKIRLAYISADFRWHAMAFLMAGVFEHHDRNRFELIGISIGSDDGSDYASRTRQSFDHFYEWAELADQDIINNMRAMQIDIAIDLMGFSTQARFGIFAGRCAPAQVNYLGYPATMGAKFMDYIIADHFLIPEISRQNYAEQIVYLPDTFQANDNKRQISPIKPARQELGLPEDKLIICSFNHTHKLTPDIFAIWIRLLRAVPDSVLWMYADNEISKNNLREQIRAAEIDPARIIFAGSVHYPDHLARLSCADLFLDAFPFNGGTSVSDALWAGLPVLTLAGETFASRMGGSLLHAAQLPELITFSLQEYEERGLQLMQNREQLVAYRQRLAENRDSCALFDTATFTRHLEAAFATIYEQSSNK